MADALGYNPFLFFLQKLRLGQSLSAEARIFCHSWPLERMQVARSVRHMAGGVQFARSQCENRMH